MSGPGKRPQGILVAQAWNFRCADRFHLDVSLTLDLGRRIQSTRAAILEYNHATSDIWIGPPRAPELWVRPVVSVIAPAQEKQNAHHQQRARDGDDPRDMVAGDVRVSGREAGEDERSDPFPSPRDTHYGQ